MQVSRRAFLMIGAGALAAKVLAPLMPTAQEPLVMPTIPQEVWDAVEADRVAMADVFVSQSELFGVGDVINFAGDNKVYRVTSVHHSTMQLDELAQDVIVETQPYKRPAKPRTYPKHFRAKQRDPWFSFAS